MGNAIVQPARSDDVGRPARGRGLAPPWQLTVVPWAAASALVVAAVAYCQARDRAPLTWDEAGRVDAGAVLDLALSAGSPGRVWDWLASLELPFVAPALHGLALTIVGDPARAAWLPSAAAFAAAGVLSAALARRLGAGAAASCATALVVWTTPIGAKLAAGAFTENLGACLLAGLVLVLDRLRRHPSRAVAASAGVLVSAAWWTSPDYGLAAAVVVAGAVAVAGSRPGSQAERLHLLAGAAAVGLVAGHGLATGSAGAPAGALGTLVTGHWSLARADLVFYPQALFRSDSFASSELGLSPVVAAALVFGILAAAAAWRRRPEVRLPVLAVGVWAGMYVPAEVTGARFVALILPVAAALAVAGVCRLLATADRRGTVVAGTTTLALATVAAGDPAVLLRLLPLVAVVAYAIVRIVDGSGRRMAGAATAVVALAAIAVLPAQIATQFSGLRHQLWFVERNEPADRAMAFIGEHLPATGSRPVLLIGPATALSPRLVQLAWDRRLGERSAGVHLVAEAGVRDRARQLAETVAALRPALVVAVRTGSGSRLAPDRTAAGRELLAGQRDYARLAVEMAGDGKLVPVASLSLEDDPVRIDIWRPAPANDRDDADR